MGDEDERCSAIDRHRAEKTVLGLQSTRGGTDGHDREYFIGDRDRLASCLPHLPCLRPKGILIIAGDSPLSPIMPAFQLMFVSMRLNV